MGNNTPLMLAGHHLRRKTSIVHGKDLKTVFVCLFVVAIRATFHKLSYSNRDSLLALEDHGLNSFSGPQSADADSPWVPWAHNVPVSTYVITCVFLIPLLTV